MSGVLRPPFVTHFNEETKDHDYIHEITENIRESDSEVVRNMKILEYFDIPMEIQRDLTMFPSMHSGDVVIHNGALKGWDRKKYPYMEDVGRILIEKGYDVSCIGSPDEYVIGKNCTGTSLKTTIGTIFNHKVYLGTDTGTYHLAALMNKPGVVVFTATDPQKNWDKDYHKSISVASTHLPCQPCQNGYHFMPEFHTCKEEYCKSLNPQQVAKMVEMKLNGN